MPEFYRLHLGRCSVERAEGCWVRRAAEFIPSVGMDPKLQDRSWPRWSRFDFAPEAGRVQFLSQESIATIPHATIRFCA